VLALFLTVRLNMMTVSYQLKGFFPHFFDQVIPLLHQSFLLLHLLKKPLVHGFDLFVARNIQILKALNIFPLELEHFLL
jgi:hypothetical protein